MDATEGLRSAPCEAWSANFIFLLRSLDRGSGRDKILLMLPMRNDGQPPGGGIAERPGRGRPAEFKTQNSLNALRRKQSALSSERDRKIPRIDTSERSLEHGGVVFDVKQLELLARLIGEQVRETCRIHALGTQAVVADKQVSSRERRCQCCSIPIDKKGVISARDAVEAKADQK